MMGARGYTRRRGFYLESRSIRASGVDGSDWQDGTMKRAAAANRVCAVFGRFSVLLMFALPATTSPHPSLTTPSGALRKLAFPVCSCTIAACGQCLTVGHTIVTPYGLCLLVRRRRIECTMIHRIQGSGRAVVMNEIHLLS